jgi:hypothetical protein
LYRQNGRASLSLRAAIGGLACLALCLGAAGCGDDDGGGSGTVSTPATTPSAPQATAPSAKPPPTDATNPGGAEHSGREEDMQDSEPVQIDATFSLDGGRLTPKTVTTPAFLAVSLSVRNRDAVPRTVVVRADRSYRMQVGAGKRAEKQIPGQRAGEYPVLVDGKRRATLVFGGEPGP